MATVPGKLIRTLTLSAVLVVIGNPVADLLGLKYWLPGVHGTSSRLFAYATTGEPADVLVLGSSLSVQGVIPRLVEDEYRRLTGQSISTYNLAMAGNGICTVAIVLRDMIDACGCPEIVVLELSPRSLDRASDSVRRALEYHASLADTAVAAPFIRGSGMFDAAGWGLLRGFLNMALWVSHPPWTEEWQEILAHWVESRGSPHAYPAPAKTAEGMEAWSDKERARRLRQNPIGKRASGDPDIVYGGLPTSALASTLDLAGACGSRVVIWTTPATPDYEACFRPAEHALFKSTLSKLAALPGVEVVDVADGRLELGDGDFTDFTHLNSRGADKLSRALARAIAHIQVDRTGS